MRQNLQWFDLFTINIYYLGQSTLSQTVTPLVLPLLIQQFVGESRQGTYYGTARLWSLMVALLVQALMGMLSDLNTSEWGRRRPFIFIGTIADLFVITGIGFTAGMEGSNGYWILFIFLILLQITANTAQGAVQGLIPDMVPEQLRGRYSGVKAILEVPIPVILVSFAIGRLIAVGNLWAALIFTMGILTITMVITMFAPETRHTGTGKPLDWTPFFRLLLMTAAFTAIILGVGETIRGLDQWLAGANLNLSLATMGIVGFIAMTATIAIGVWVCIKLSIGQEANSNPSFTWWVVNRLSFLVGSTNLASFAVFFLQGKLGLPGEKAAAPAAQLIMFVGLLILILGIPGGWLTDRIGRKPIIAISGLTAAVGALVLVIAPDLIAIYVGAILVGSATGMFFSANWALGTDIVPKDEAGRYLGISNLAGAGAGAVGAYIGGPIADYFTANYQDFPGLGYVVLYAIYGGIFLISIAALAGVKST